MRKNDWLGLSFSIGIHLVLLILFAIVTTATTPVNVGFIEVDVGVFAQGRPTRNVNAVNPRPIPPRPEPEQVEPPKPQTAPEITKPVDLPEQEEDVIDEEVVNTPETETVTPTPPQEEAEVEETEEEPQPEPLKPLGGSASEGTDASALGDEGVGTDEEKTSPFSLEGLNRTYIRAPLPAYKEKVNAVIRMRITVDPSGRVVSVLPLRKGNPALEQAVRQALLKWQFNALATNVPQENQHGVITFYFQLK